MEWTYPRLRMSGNWAFELFRIYDGVGGILPKFVASNMLSTIRGR